MLSLGSRLVPKFLIPKSLFPEKAPGEYRLIHRLPFPSVDSVNDGIVPEHTSVSYARVDEQSK